MKKLGLLGTSAIGSAAFIGMSLALAGPAYGQSSPTSTADTPPPCPANQPQGNRDNCLSGEVENQSATNANAPGATSDAIVVTGTRIRSPNLQSTVPVTSISGQEFFETGQVAIGDVLNELPGLRSTFSQANSTRFLGTAGLNLLDLRGLGTQRTLVLVNGRRHVPGDILNNAVSTDVNTIPTDLIERVDVVTGGESAIYGSDAVAGVVNFILKDHFDGAQLRGQGGISKYGDAGSYFASLLLGKNFAGNRGNIAVNFEYARQDQYFGSGRPNIATNSGFVVVDTDPAGAVNGSDGNPDRLFFRDIRSATLTNTGLVRFGGNARLACGTDPIGGVYNCPFQFTPDGQLVPVTGTRIGLGPNGSFIGGNGENFRGQNQFQMAPQLNRYNVNLIGHFTISDAFEPFIEAKYSRTDSYGSGSSGPAFITGSTLGDSREAPRLSNPFLSAQARALIIQQLTLANGVAPAATARFSLRENLLDLGVRSESARRETYRAVAGIRGNFNEDWHYEISANYGEFREKTRVQGNLNVQRFLLGMDAVRDPVSGQIVCNSRINPAAAIAYPFADPAVANGNLAGDVAACVPINPFGGQFSDAVRNYVLQDTTSVGKITQFVGSAFLAGDSSQLFSLPGGPIGFSIGAEYRRETNYFREDPLVESGLTFYNAIAAFTPPAFEVKEAFGELRIPLLKDTPFFHNLELDGAARVAHYKGSTGTVYAFNAGGDWAPVQDFRFRGNFSRAVRAPNLSELYSPQSQNFAPGFVDPCSARNLGTGSTTRAGNCTAAGAPAGYDFVYSQSLEIVSGGNPGLKAETSNSLTLGGVFTPRFLPGFSLSADYYNIKVNNVISSLSAQTIADQCYDSPTLGNPFCGLFQRAGAAGGPHGEVPFQILEGSLLQSTLNFAKLKARGLDVEAAYNHRFSFGAVSSRLTYTHVFQRDDFLDPTRPNAADQILLELGDPQDELVWRVGVKSGPYSVDYMMHYIGHMVLNLYEDTFSKQGNPPQNADYANVRFYPSVFYHNIRFGIDASSRFNFYAGIDNVLDRKPPYGLTGIGGGSAIYDARGRFFYAGFIAKY